MNNNSYGLIIAGVAIVAVAIVAIVMYIYSTGSNSATDAFSDYSTEEINAFNTQFEIYTGDKKGSNVANLMSKLIVNANASKDNLEKIPAVTITNKINESSDSGKNVETPQRLEDISTYVAELGSLKQQVNDKHTYKVTANYNSAGLINEFLISY